MRCKNHDDAAHDRQSDRHAQHAHVRSTGIVLWRLQGSLDELTCAVRCTSYGYTLSLELAGEPILLELQSSVDVLVDKAARLETWLLTQGWERMPDEQVLLF
jgi:hypothetical protein